MCGIFGIYNHPEALKLTRLGLFSLQHRGQESAGISVSNGQKVGTEKGMGLVPKIFQGELLEKLEILNGSSAIGHVRYSTKGDSSLRNAQPHWAETLHGRLVLASNGDIINLTPQREFLMSKGIKFQSANDAEVVVKSIGLYLLEKNRTIPEAIDEMMSHLQGAYSSIILTEEELFVFRDPFGIRPLFMGQINGAYAFASETCAFDTIGAEFIREVAPGEIITLNQEGLKSMQAQRTSLPLPGLPLKRQALCVFELIYFSRPDSSIYDQNLHLLRQRMGAELARQYPQEADLVIPIPDTGIPAAIGYSQASGIPYGEGLIKNRYIGRTFIEPTQKIREEKARLKYNPLKKIIQGKRLIVLEDSIVRGTTTQSILGRLRDGGAREIHLRITSPPYKFPCFYGIDTGVTEDLIASQKSVEAIRKFISADSLGYLSLEGLFQAIGVSQDSFCSACFTGQYPLPIPKSIPSKFELERA